MHWRTLSERTIRERPAMDSDIALHRLPEVVRRTGLKKSTIYKLIKEGNGRFPAPIKIPGSRTSVWDSRAITEYIQSVLAAAKSTTSGGCHGQ